ncbi:hypothetical protein [Fodinicola acaciae]|uniref:hypothetical protein n=1 Tax=Fodinicola acaciae TaxID=2681555 RepID=UPI0013D662BF|nr:hypothetical protein [Fodinicola acaciae]
MGEARDSTLSGKVLEFNPIVNGVDFLDSAISNLADSQDPRNLKYAVLHLQAAIEILVKVRLQREGIKHVFDDPYSVDLNKFRQGDFRSVSLSAALKRLDRVAGIQLADKERGALNFLSKERNKLQHFGSTSNHEVVATRAAAALDVLSQFIQRHLTPDAPEQEVAHLDRAEGLIRGALTSIAAVSWARLTRIGPELDAWSGIVIHCPDCLQMAWTFLPHEGSSRCHFCGRDWSQEDQLATAVEYVENVLGESRHVAVKDGGGLPIATCPECEFAALVMVATRNDPNTYLTAACFYCGFSTNKRLGSCGRCGTPTLDPDDGICPNCLNDLVARD